MYGVQGLHRIEYDDGDEEMLDLSTQTWHLLPDMKPGSEGLEMFDNGGLGRLHSAAQALALGNTSSRVRAQSLMMQWTCKDCMMGELWK